MSTNQNLAIFDYLRGYLVAATTQCGDAGVVNCADPNNMYQKYYKQRFYLKTNPKAKDDDVAKDFADAVVAFGANLKEYDASTGAGNTLKREFLALVNAQATELADAAKTALSPNYVAAGTLEATKSIDDIVIALKTVFADAVKDGTNIKSIKLQNTAIKPYDDKVAELLTNVSIEPSDETNYKSIRSNLESALESSIVTEVITGAAALKLDEIVDKLRTLSVTGLTNAVTSFISSKYTTVAAGITAKAKDALELLKKGNVNSADMSLFRLFCSVLRGADAVKETDYNTIDVTKDRINLKTETIDFGGGNLRKSLKVINWLPVVQTGASLKIYVGNETVNVTTGYELRLIFDEAYTGKNLHGVNVTKVDTSLPVDLQALVKDVILRKTTPSAHLADDDLEGIDQVLAGRWKRVGVDIWEHKLADGTSVIYKPNTPEFDNLISQQISKCGLVGFETNKAECRNFLDEIARGSGDINKLADIAVKMTDAVTNEVVKDLHPKIALAILKAFGFRRKICKDKVAGRQIEKVQSVDDWLKTFVDKKFDSTRATNIKANDKLTNFLNLLSQLINSNPSVLNDSYVGETEESRGDINIPEQLRSRNIGLAKTRGRGQPVLSWNQITDGMHKVYGSFKKGLTFENGTTNSPFGMDNLFPSILMPTAAQVRGSTTGGLFGGGSELKVILDEHPTALEYSRNIVTIFDELLSNLRSSKKSLSDEDRKVLTGKIAQFITLEGELFDTARNIQTYSQLLKVVEAENRPEIVTQKHISSYVDRYNHLLNRYEKTGNSFQTLISLLKDCQADGSKGCQTDGEL